MSLRLLIAFMTLLPLTSFAQSIRFPEEKISFRLQDNDGGTVECSHKLLPQVPWWSVTCGKRLFTVNTWVQMAHNKDQELSKVTLMYDVSEGVSSSGEKLVQFHSHFTHFYVDSLSYIKKVSSDMDVQNGQMNLIMTGELW